MCVATKSLKPGLSNLNYDVIYWLPLTWFNIWKIFPNPRSSWAVANIDDEDAALPESISEVTFWREKLLSDKNFPSSDIFAEFGGHKKTIQENYSLFF